MWPPGGPCIRKRPQRWDDRQPRQNAHAQEAAGTHSRCTSIVVGGDVFVTGGSRVVGTYGGPRVPKPVCPTHLEVEAVDQLDHVVPSIGGRRVRHDRGDLSTVCRDVGGLVATHACAGAGAPDTNVVDHASRARGVQAAVVGPHDQSAMESSLPGLTRSVMVREIALCGRGDREGVRVVVDPS
eukprot:1386093-Prymnesium_polylepis.2